MATTTRRLLRQYLSEDGYIGDWLADTTTSDGAADGSTLVCSALKGISQDNDYFKNWWVVLPTGPDGAGSYEARKVSAYTGTSGTLTVSGYRSFSAQVASGVSFELHRYDPSWKHAAINEAARMLAGRGLYLPVSDVSLIADGLATNATFQTYAGSFTGWTSVGTPTITEETTTVMSGFARSAGVAATGATEGLLQNVRVRASHGSLVGKTLHVRAWIWCAAASSARVRVTFDGSTFYSTAYHSGTSQWEGPADLRIDVGVPSSGSQMMLLVEVASGATAYCQMVAAWVDRVYRYAVPSSLRFVDRVYQQADEGVSDSWEPIGRHNPPISGRVLKLVGRGTLTLPSSDTGTMEVGDHDMELLLKQASVVLLNRAASETMGSDAAELRALSARADAELERMLARGNYGQHVAYSARNGAWRTEWESGSLYLYMEV